VNAIVASLGFLANAGLVLLLAPLAEGLLRRVTARLQSRQGPPLAQPYFDLLKLLGKEDIETGAMPRLQRLAAGLGLATVLAVAGFVPMGFRAPLGEAGDILALVYLLTLAGIGTLLAGLAAGSTYSILGSHRELLTMIALEPLLAVALLAGAVQAQSLRLDAVLHGSVYATPGVPYSGLLLLGVMVFAFQAFVQRVPFDISEAETEIMEGPLVEYSGPKLAMLKAARMAKLIVYSALVVALFLPWGNDWTFPFGWLWFWAKVFAIVLAVTAIAATHARYRIDQAVRYFAGLLAAAFVALAIACTGH
jgi:formate hydrogenlyase subunit 4